MSPKELHFVGQVLMADGKNVVPDVWKVLDQIKEFTDRVRCGEWRGATGEKITSVVAVGIGGSFLGPLFVHTALETNQVCTRLCCGDEKRGVTRV